MADPFARMSAGLGVNIERGFTYLAGGTGRPRPFPRENARYLRDHGVTWVRVFFDCFQVPGQGSDFASPPLQPIVEDRAGEGILGFPAAWRWPWSPGTTIIPNRDVMRAGVRFRAGQPYPFVRIGRGGAVELAGERTDAPEEPQPQGLRLMQPSFFLNGEEGRLRRYFDAWAASIDALVAEGLVVAWTIFGKNIRDYADAGTVVGIPGFQARGAAARRARSLADGGRPPVGQPRQPHGDDAMARSAPGRPARDLCLAWLRARLGSSRRPGAASARVGREEPRAGGHRRVGHGRCDLWQPLPR